MTKMASWTMERTQAIQILILNTKILGVDQKGHLLVQEGEGVVEVAAEDVVLKM